MIDSVYRFFNGHTSQYFYVYHHFRMKCFEKLCVLSAIVSESPDSFKIFSTLTNDNSKQQIQTLIATITITNNEMRSSPSGTTLQSSLAAYIMSKFTKSQCCLCCMMQVVYLFLFDVCFIPVYAFGIVLSHLFLCFYFLSTYTSCHSTCTFDLLHFMADIRVVSFEVDVQICFSSLFSITIILQSIEIDQRLLQVADGLPTLSVDTYYERGRRQNFSCSADKQRERKGEGEGKGEEGSGKGCGRVIEFDNIDSLSTLTLLGDGIYSNSPTIHYESEESGDLLTLLFNTCDDKNKGIITAAGT